jgi:NAD(P)-dependent dehydrogenase (short-subunit alcohol dehydrogenase family)
MTDSVILVTGGAGNLGRAVTREFLERGARVAVPIYKTDSAGALDELTQEHSDRLHSFPLDLTTERGAEQAIRRVKEWGGGLDAVAHLIGGYSAAGRLAEAPLDEWDRMIDLNLRSAWLIARFAIPAMQERGGGSLVFVSSRAARKVGKGQGAYAVSKAALVTLAEVISEEYRQEGIRANAVLPGTVDTPANRASMPDADHARWTSPSEIASVIAYLASPESAAVTGAAVSVQGRS